MYQNLFVIVYILSRIVWYTLNSGRSLNIPCVIYLYNFHSTEIAKQKTQKETKQYTQDIIFRTV